MDICRKNDTHAESTDLSKDRCEKKLTITHLRYVIVALATLVSAIGLSCNFAFNFASICGINSSVDAKEIYEKHSSNSAVMYFPTSEMSLLYSAYPMGNFCTLILIVFWSGYSNLSVRWTVFLTTLISTVSTLLVPPLYDRNIHSTLVLKILQGASVAPTVPLAGHVTARWTPKREIGMFVSILTSFSQVGLFFVMATSGIMCEWFAWRGIFYLNGIVSLVIALLWMIFYRDNPAEHPWLNTEELKVIETGKVAHANNIKEPVPYREFFSCVSVWACFIGAIGNYNGISPFVTFASLILKKAVNLTNMQTSQFNSMSFIMQLVLKLFSGRISDSWTSVSETNKVRLFNTLSCGLAGILVVITAFLPVNNKVLCACFITFFQGIIGFNSAGFNKAAVLVARQHSHLVLTCFGLIVTFSTVSEPFLVYYIAPNSTWDEWFGLFIGHGIILIVCNFIFCLLIDARPAKFTEISAIPMK